jgi:hypothetical protein
MKHFFSHAFSFAVGAALTAVVCLRVEFGLQPDVSHLSCPYGPKCPCLKAGRRSGTLDTIAAIRRGELQVEIETHEPIDAASP